LRKEAIARLVADGHSVDQARAIVKSMQVLTRAGIDIKRLVKEDGNKPKILLP
jgi:DNA-binding CsgD family transcriptional regulator